MIVVWKAASGSLKTRLLEQIFRSKAGLIRQLTRKAANAENTAADMEDLLQAGRIGFVRALERFDPGREISIATYAGWWIRHEVQRVARSAPVIALPRIRLTNEERSRVVLALRGDPGVEPESLGVRRAQLEQVRNSIGLRFLSTSADSVARAVERRAVVHDDDDEPLDAHRARAMEAVLARVRAGATAEQLQLSAEGFAAARQIIANERKRGTMDEEKLEPPTPRAARMRGQARKPRKDRGLKKAAKPGAPLPPRAPAAPPGDCQAKAAARLAEFDAEREAERKLLALFVETPPAVARRVIDLMTA